MKKTNVFSKIVLVGVCVAILITGCGMFFNPSNYVKVTFDAMYNGMFEEYTKVTDTPADQAQAQYEAGYKAQADVFATVYGFTDKDGKINMSDEIREKVEELYKELFSQVQYVVDENSNKTQTEYKVNFAITPVTTLKDKMSDVSAFVDRYNADIIAGKYNDETVYPQAKIDLEYEQGILDILTNATKNPTFGEAQTFSVRVVHDVDKNTYYINTDDLIAINKAIIKYPS